MQSLYEGIVHPSHPTGIRGVDAMLGATSKKTVSSGTELYLKKKNHPVPLLLWGPSPVSARSWRTKHTLIILKSFASLARVSSNFRTLFPFFSTGFKESRSVSLSQSLRAALHSDSQEPQFPQKRFLPSLIPSCMHICLHFLCIQRQTM